MLNLFNNFKTLVDKLKMARDGGLSPRPALPLNLTALLSSNDDIDDDTPAEVLAERIGSAFFITYKASNGDISKRRITVKTVKKSNDNNLLVYAYCHERQALRSFRGDRIIEVVDIATGEVFEGDKNIVELCNVIEDMQEEKQAEQKDKRAIYDRTRRLIKSVQDDINVLVYVARCDDELHEREVETIVEYVVSHHKRSEAIIDKDKIKNTVLRSYPDEGTYLESLNIKTDNIRTQRLVDTIVKIIKSDDKIHPAEEDFLNGVATPTAS